MDPAESRRELDVEIVRTRLDAAGWAGPLPQLRTSVGSTNDEAAALARAGAPEGTSVIAEEQTAGRGRAGRAWTSPAGAGLWLSTIVRPGPVPVERWTWLPLLAGLATRDAVRAAGVPAQVKWPNDLVVTAGADSEVRKLGGLLSEVVGDAVVIGIGINVGLDADALPTLQATSLQLEGGSLDRAALAATLLSQLTLRLAQWRADDPVLASDYRAACTSIGRLVEVALPGGQVISGMVDAVDDAGRLVVDDGESLSVVAAGDVVHATI